MKKNIVYLLTIATMLFASCTTENTPQPTLYPATATYELNGKACTATDGVWEVQPILGYEGFEDINNYLRFNLKSKEHSLQFMLHTGNTTNKILEAGDVLSLNGLTIVNEAAGLGQVFGSFVLFYDGNSKKEILMSLPSEEANLSYFKVTRNDKEFFEGEFEFRYGITPTRKKTDPTIVVGSIKKGFVSIKKQKK
jgi:hypothetical protein